MPHTFEEREAQVDIHIRENAADKAVALLFELIVEAARRKDFQKAESLRDRIYEVDPLALTEIIRSGEIIEEEKNLAIDQDHRTVWRSLYDELDPAEAAELFHAMKQTSFAANETILRQGQITRQLHFIDEGEVKLLHESNGRELFLRMLAPGELLGEDAFFTITVCTSSAVAVSRTRTSYIGEKTLLRWEKDFPSLAVKLQIFCENQRKVSDIIRHKQLERRAHMRHTLTGQVALQLLDGSGNPSGIAFTAALTDLSNGGLSCFITTGKEETARLLLGRRLKARFSLPVQGERRTLEVTGTVVAVSALKFNDYAVHFRFDRLLGKPR